MDWLACSWATPYFPVPWRCLVVVHSCARLVAGRLDGILRVSRSLCRGCLRNPLVREVCVGLSRGEGLGSCQGLGRRGVDWLVGGSLVSSLAGVPGRVPGSMGGRQSRRSWTECRSRESAERGSSLLGRGSSVLQDSEMDLDSSELRV